MQPSKDLRFETSRWFLSSGLVEGDCKVYRFDYSSDSFLRAFVHHHSQGWQKLKTISEFAQKSSFWLTELSENDAQEYLAKN